jgi:hypothetical protein
MTSEPATKRSGEKILKLCAAAIGVGLFLAVLSACAQQPDTRTHQEREALWKSCPDGYYSGPRPGRLNYDNDKYLWVVTPEFAKRFCMPDEMVDPELKGAEAIAFKRVSSEDGNDRCAVQADGKPSCVDDGVGRFEVYLLSSLNLPAAHPEVKFFDGERNHSGGHISGGLGRKLKMAKLYEQGLYQLPQGAINRFGNPYAHPDRGYQFGLIGIQQNNREWGLANLWEVGFRAEWAIGIDLVILENRGMAGALDINPRGVAAGVDRYAIVLDDSRKPKKCPWSDCALVPDDFEHVIYLPSSFVTHVKSSLDQTGTWADFIRTFRQPRSPRRTQ